MKFAGKPLLDLLGYSRKERRSSSILFIILVIIIVARYLVPGNEIKVKDLSGLLTSDSDVREGFAGIPDDRGRLFSFDPNSASGDTLKALGLTARQAGTIISYRNSGGRFYKPSDIKKIYGIDDSTAAALVPFINIKKEMEGEKYIRKDTDAKQKRREMIDLNRCDSAALDRLPGIGPVLSSRIIKYRKLLGGFSNREQLKEVYGLSDSTYRLVEERVFADSTVIRRINVNDQGFNGLSRHPYLSRYEIQSIVKFKELKGRISGMSELIDNKVLTSDRAKKISPYLGF